MVRRREKGIEEENNEMKQNPKINTSNSKIVDTKTTNIVSAD